MKVVRLSIFFCLMAGALSLSCQRDNSNNRKDKRKDFYAKGADISWATEMEDKGYKFYTQGLKETECTALLRQTGFNSVRFRVWVNPEDGYCGREDLLKKCRRARDLGMKIMIDFHYSDSWADPGKQNVPESWQGLDVEHMADSVTNHTFSVLHYLKENNIDVDWVQVGNEVENGILWESGRVEGNHASGFSAFFKAGASAVHKVYPQAKVIIHTSNAWKTDTLIWFFNLMEENNVDYDIIGLSLYPSYMKDGVYPDWFPNTQAAVNNFTLLNKTYGKDIIVAEFGMPACEPEKSKACLQYLIDNTENKEWFKGIFLWEPESEESRNNYLYGAFDNGHPTVALDPFRQ